jgi:pimeloyl-ACP methyl ester carboxylesterase
MLEGEFLEKAFADPAVGQRDYRAMTDDEVTVVARNREAAAFYAWSPYMHDPKLKGRLHRIRIPTLVLWGAADRLVGEAYGRAFAAALPYGVFETIAGAGHFPHIEQPKAFAERALAFANGMPVR